MISMSYGRRRFLQGSALFSAGLIASIVNDRIARANDEPVEAVVIGSGFGGSVAALRLGQAGIHTVLLERGRRWSITNAQNTFTTYQNPDGRAAWLSPTTWDGVPVDIYTGILERKDENGITVLCGSGVGGGSLVYNATLYQPPRELFYRVFPQAISYHEMDKIYYPLVRSMLKPSPIPKDILATKYYESSRLYLQQATTAGLPNYLADVAVDWNIIREEIQGTKVPSAIVGQDWYGINSGAKNSLDRNYLAQAEQTGYVEILPLHIVTEITEVPGVGYRISSNQINESGETIASKYITCKYLFLGAGSMGTSALLVKAKATGTLPSLNEYIGQGWATDGDGYGIRSGLPPVSTPRGGPSSAIVQHFDNPIGPVSVVYGTPWGDAETVLTCLCIGLPAERGSFNYDAATGLVKLTWPFDAPGNRKLVESLKFTFNLIDKKNTTTIYKPTTNVVIGNGDGGSCAHPLGGAVLGKACDLFGRVKGYQGLYVVDGALIPGSTGCTNPALTIAAMSERCIERIIAEDIS